MTGFHRINGGGRGWVRAGVLLAAAVLISSTALAHRVDEYLQTTFVSIERDHVDLDLALTPGTRMAPEILAAVDSDRNGVISGEEQTAYAEKVQRAVRLEVDRVDQTLKLIAVRFPPIGELREGVGLIHIQLRATSSRMGSGNHQLDYFNGHQTNGSVYLVNALVPASPLVRVGSQKRDSLQQGTRIDFEILAPSSSNRSREPKSADELARGIEPKDRGCFRDYLYATAALEAPARGMTSNRVNPASVHQERKSAPE